MSAVNAMLSPGVCFDHWAGPWEDTNSGFWGPHCFAPEERENTLRGKVQVRPLSLRNPCSAQPSPPSTGLITREQSFYCGPESDLVNVPGSSEPVCRLKADQMHPKKQPRSASCCVVGDPINLSTGELYERELDYAGSGPFPLRLERHYSAGAWNPSYRRHLRLNEDLVITTGNVPVYSMIWAVRDDAQEIPFSKLNGTIEPPAPDIVERLEKVMTAGVQTGWRFRDANDAVELYDIDGKLQSITNRAGLTQTLSYDASGRLSTVTDAFGRQLVWSYDAGDRVASVTIPGGALIQYGYDANGQLSTVTYPDSSVRTYVYNEPAYTGGANLPGALTGIIDESSDRHAIFRYDASGRVVQTEHAGGADRTTVAYTSASSRTVTDALNVARTVNLIVKNNVAHFASASGPACTNCPFASAYTYDARGNLTNRVSLGGTTTTRSYTNDGRNLVSQITEGSGLTSRYAGFTWHSTLRVPMQITRGYLRTNFTRDTRGNVLTRTETEQKSPYSSRVWTSTYDANSQLLTEDGPRSDVSDITTYTYYSCTTGYECGQLHTVTNALNQTTTYNSYNAHGQSLTITDPNGVVTTLTYDGRQRLTSTQVGNETTTYTYWPTGLIRRVTLPDSSYVEYTYDEAHRLVRLEDGDGNRIEYTLDLMGNRVAENVFDPSSALSRTHTRVFNASNQLWKEIGAAGTPAVTTEFGYDGNNNLTSIAGPLSRNTTLSYDALQRVNQIVDPATGTTVLNHATGDELTFVRDPKNWTTYYSYNGFGEVTQVASTDTGTTVNTHDVAGNLATTRDARNKTGTYTYDALNRPLSLTYPDLITTFTYDTGTNGVGCLASASDANQSLAFAYDPLGRVTGKSQSVGGVTQSVSYGYTNGNLASVVTPSGQTIEYSYSNGKISGITLNGSTTILEDVLYEPFGPVAGWAWGNSTIAVRVYDQDGKPTDIDSAGAYQYSYDDAFRVTGITDLSDSSKSWTYGYDVMDRLNSTSRSGLNQTFTYDANGNRLTQGGSSSSTYSVSGPNRLASVSGALSRTYTYATSGQVLSDGTRTFTYSDAGRLKTVTSGGVTTTYVLNAFGQRVMKSNASVTRLFVYDETGHLLGEYDAAGNLVAETVWLGDIPVATLRPDGAGVGVFYIHTDHLNTPRRISRPSDNVIVWRWDSDPFGTTAANQDPDGDSVQFVSNLRFPGQYFDSESGLSYNYYRDGYDPTVGRYTQSDPIGLRGGINTYLYAEDNPVWLADSLGLAPGDRFPTAAAAAEDIASYQDSIDEHNRNWKTFLFGPSWWVVGPYQVGCEWTWDLVTPIIGFPPVGRKPGKLGRFKGTDALRRENQVARDAAKQANLSKDQARQLHDEISGQNLTYQEILQRALEIAGK